MDQRQQAALKAIHSDLLVLLTDVARVLEDNHLPYSVMCGTLLGAVRHHGFIPWDDDVDLVMPRSSYDRFAALYPAQCGAGCQLDLMDTWVPRVRMQGGARSAFIDLFVLDPLPNGRLSRFCKLFSLRALQGMLKEETDYRRFTLAKRILLGATALLGKPFSKAAKLRVYARLARRGNPDSPLVHMSNGAFGLLDMAFDRETFESPALSDFDGLAVRIPRNSAAVLTRLYGPDYLTPPPENQRIPLHLDL